MDPGTLRTIAALVVLAVVLVSVGAWVAVPIVAVVALACGADRQRRHQTD